MYPPTETVAESSGPAQYALKPIWGLFNGCPGTRLFRYTLQEKVHDKDLRRLGPSAVLRAAVEVLDGQQCAKDTLDAALPPSGLAEQVTASLLPAGRAADAGTGGCNVQPRKDLNKELSASAVSAPGPRKLSGAGEHEGADASGR